MSTRNFQIVYFVQGDKIVALAMELFERGLIGTGDTQDIEARFALEGKGERVRSIQDNRAYVDSLGICTVVRGSMGFSDIPKGEVLAEARSKSCKNWAMQYRGTFNMAVQVRMIR